MPLISPVSLSLVSFADSCLLLAKLSVVHSRRSRLALTGGRYPCLWVVSNIGTHTGGYRDRRHPGQETQGAQGTLRERNKEG